MPCYGPVWLEIAREQYASLPAETREQVDARIEQLLENPRRPAGGYDELTDQWTTIFGDGAGLIVYAAVHEQQRASPHRRRRHWVAQPAAGAAEVGHGTSSARAR